MTPASALIWPMRWLSGMHRCHASAQASGRLSTNSKSSPPARHQSVHRAPSGQPSAVGSWSLCSTAPQPLLLQRPATAESSPSLLSVPPARQGRCFGLQASSCWTSFSRGVGRWWRAIAWSRRVEHKAMSRTLGSSCRRARPSRLSPWGPLVTSTSPGRAALRCRRRGPRRPSAVIESSLCSPLEQSPPSRTPPYCPRAALMP